MEFLDLRSVFDPSFPSPDGIDWREKVLAADESGSYILIKTWPTKDQPWYRPFRKGERSVYVSEEAVILTPEEKARVWAHPNESGGMGFYCAYDYDQIVRIAKGSEERTEVSQPPFCILVEATMINNKGPVVVPPKYFLLASLI